MKKNPYVYERPTGYTPPTQSSGVLFWISISILWALVVLVSWAALEFYFPHSAKAEEGQLNLSSAFSTPKPYSFGLEIGQCDADGNIIMCNENYLVLHLYVRGKFYLTESKGLIATITADHYSSPEEEDFGPEPGSGSFFYRGIGLGYEF